MQLHSASFQDGDPIPGEFAFAVPDPTSHVTFAANRNPAFEWSDVPDGTLSFALMCIDADAPTVTDDVNQEDREVPEDLPRTDFVHWVIVDLDPGTRSIDVADYSDGVTARGKPGLSSGPREGVNDYTDWFAGDPDMEGTYRGYDGPGPPWNDSIAHCYTFTIYALDVDHLDVDGDFNADDVTQAMAGHVLAQAECMGTYTLNPRLV